MPNVAIDRKYQMTRLRAGAYLLPGNTGEHLYRLTRYNEDGTLRRLQPDGSWRSIVGDFWEVHHIARAMIGGAWPLAELDYWPWRDVEYLLPTRAAAIAAALEHEARQ